MSKVKYTVLLTLLLLAYAGNTTAQKSWKDVTTVSDLCEFYPEIVRGMFEDFNLDYPGLEQVKTAFISGNLAGACVQLLAYYQQCQNALHLRKVLPPAVTGKSKQRTGHEYI